MAGGQSNELGEPTLKAHTALRPQLVMQEDPYRVEPGQPGDAQLAVDLLQVIGVRLEHLQLIARVRRNEVGADQPTLLGVPAVRPLR